MDIKYTDNFESLDIDIIKSLNDANVFYSKEYGEYNKSIKRKMIYLYNERYILPCIIIHKLCFTFGYFPSETYEWNSESKYNEQNFLDDCIRILRDIFRLLWLRTPSACAVFKIFPKESIKIPCGNLILDLEESEEVLWSKIQCRNRNKIRKAEKGNIAIKFGGIELIEDFYKLDSITRERSGLLPETKDYYKQICEKLKSNAIIFVAYKENEPQGAALFFYNSNTCYYMYAASCNDPYNGSMSLLIWKAILYMKKFNVKRYNFVGYRLNVEETSKHYGIQSFKAKFGCTLEKCFSFKCIFKRRYYMLYKFLCSIKAILYGKKYRGDIIDQEISKWKTIEGNEKIKQKI